MFSVAGVASTAPSPSPPDRSTLCHMWVLCSPVDTGTLALLSHLRDTPHDHSGAPCRLEAPDADHSTVHDSLQCTDSCMTVPLARTPREHIYYSDSCLDLLFDHIKDQSVQGGSHMSPPSLLLLCMLPGHTHCRNGSLEEHHQTCSRLLAARHLWSAGSGLEAPR